MASTPLGSAGHPCDYGVDHICGIGRPPERVWRAIRAAKAGRTGD